MSAKNPKYIEATFDRMISGGQAIATLSSGKKLMAWNALPHETAVVQVTKSKSSHDEGIAVEILRPSPDRVRPKDPDSYISTSPWQILSIDTENVYKSQLIDEAFRMHHIELPGDGDMCSNSRDYGYRNKIEFSFWWDNDVSRLDLAFFRRASHTKIPVNGTHLAPDEINNAGLHLRDILRDRACPAYDLKTVILRCNSQGHVVAQLYVQTPDFTPLTDNEIAQLNIAGFELVYSNPKSPASVITERLQSWGNTYLTDTILHIPFRYAVEGFFQINLPVYEQVLMDMQQWVPADKPLLDLYSGVGTIGLTIPSCNVTLVEINEHAVREMQNNIERLGRTNARAELCASEHALEYITHGATIVVDPPRAGLHESVVHKLLDVQPRRILYLSCNPVTQARDIALLRSRYSVVYHRGYNFFPHTPHVESLCVLDLVKNH